MLDSRTEQQPGESAPSPRRRLAPQIVAGGVLLVIGALWLLERLGALDLTVTTALAVGTIVVGLALMYLATDGPHGGLIVFGTVLALLATLTAVAPLEGFQGGVGERVVEATDVGELQAEYNLAMGTLTIDLTDLEALDQATTLAVSVGMGELVIRVPEGMPVSITASAGAGQATIFDRSAEGLGVDLAFESDSFAASPTGLTIEAEVFMGTVEVTDG
jgi:hypothetical protein